MEYFFTVGTAKGATRHATLAAAEAEAVARVRAEDDGEGVPLMIWSARAPQVAIYIEGGTVYRSPMVSAFAAGEVTQFWGTPEEVK